MLARKKRRKYLLRRKRTLDPGLIIDYKYPEILKRFITDRGKIIPRRISGATQEQQRKIALAIKRARFISLLPYSVSHETERGFAGEVQAVAQTFASAARPRSPRGPGSFGPGAGSAPSADMMPGSDQAEIKRAPRADRPERTERTDRPAERSERPKVKIEMKG